MSGHPFRIVDVFAERKYAGNQLAVVLGAAGLDAATMQSIAREFGFSETTFVSYDEEGPQGFEVRIFTPAAEVPFAGHPTLGTAWVIRDALAGPPRERITLALGVGQVPVRFEPEESGSELSWMHQPAPTFGPEADASELAALLGLELEAIASAHPVQQVSTGLPFWIVPLRGLADVRACRLDLARHDAFIRDREARAILVFACEAYDPTNRINARMFAPFYGVPEDPATGSANGCLAAYLSRHRVLGDAEVDVRVEQGTEIGRPSLLHLRAGGRDGRIEVFVGGRVIEVARGVLV